MFLGAKRGGMMEIQSTFVLFVRFNVKHVRMRPPSMRNVLDMAVIGEQLHCLPDTLSQIPQDIATFIQMGCYNCRTAKAACLWLISRG